MNTRADAPGPRVGTLMLRVLVIETEIRASKPPQPAIRDSAGTDADPRELVSLREKSSVQRFLNHPTRHGRKVCLPCAGAGGTDTVDRALSCA